MFEAIQNNINSASGINWIIMLIAINFIPEGEKIIKKMIASLGGGRTGPNLQGSAGGLKGAYQRSMGNIRQIAHGISHRNH